MSRQLWEVTETKFSAGPSRVMGPAELIEMVQYAQMFNIAKVHRDFLESAITSAGSERVKSYNVELCVYFYFAFSPASHGI